ncbi:hypothetical protein JZ751_012404 [Albula glossodonta]|uniref:Uncharacterized protein n=1 Tax=Albula glossodonta TaxID=121402 RepID=A0A8T2PSF7_9TELE|nr:hypothetical protein JZ751_012404 [Albula glossodonta]
MAAGEGSGARRCQQSAKNLARKPSEAAGPACSAKGINTLAANSEGNRGAALCQPKSPPPTLCLNQPTQAFPKLQSAISPCDKCGSRAGCIETPTDPLHFSLSRPSSMVLAQASIWCRQRAATLVYGAGVVDKKSD